MKSENTGTPLQAEPRVRKEGEQEILELVVARVNDEIEGLTLGFRREVLKTALSRIPEDLVEAEADNIDAQIEVLCGRKPGRIGHMDS
jgi:hypothetical protein